MTKIEQGILESMINLNMGKDGEVKDNFAGNVILYITLFWNSLFQAHNFYSCLIC